MSFTRAPGSIRYTKTLWLVLLAATACSQGPIGPQGPQGPQGPPGATPPGYFDVFVYGAKADQPSLDSTQSFQSALDAAPARSTRPISSL
jgi:hypothetical protein